MRTVKVGSHKTVEKSVVTVRELLLERVRCASEPINTPTVIKFIKDSNFSMILFWVAMRSSRKRNKFAIFLCSSILGVITFNFNSLLTANPG